MVSAYPPVSELQPLTCAAKEERHRGLVVYAGMNGMTEQSEPILVVTTSATSVNASQRFQQFASVRHTHDGPGHLSWHLALIFERCHMHESNGAIHLPGYGSYIEPRNEGAAHSCIFIAAWLDRARSCFLSYLPIRSSST